MLICGFLVAYSTRIRPKPLRQWASGAGVDPGSFEIQEVLSDGNCHFSRHGRLEEYMYRYEHLR